METIPTKLVEFSNDYPKSVAEEMLFTNGIHVKRKQVNNTLD